MPTPEEVIAAILGTPPDQPALVVDRQRRRARLEQQGRILYRPWSPVRAPAPAALPTPAFVRRGCAVCALAKCICPRN